MSATVCSAALVMFEVGALTTMTPALGAAPTSTLSRPTPARAATTRSFGAWATASALTWVALRTIRASTLGESREERGPVGSVDLTDLEVRPEDGETGLGELLCDQYDGLVHR